MDGQEGLDRRHVRQRRHAHAAFTAGDVDVQDTGFADTTGTHVFVVEGGRLTRDGAVVASGADVNAAVRTAGPMVIGAMEMGALSYYNFAKMDLAYRRVWEAQPDGSYELVHNYLPAQDANGAGALYDTVDRRLIAAAVLGDGAKLVAENGGTIVFDGALAADAGNVTFEARGTAAGATSKVRYAPLANLAAGNTNIVLKADGNAQVIVSELRANGGTWNPGQD